MYLGHLMARNLPIRWPSLADVYNFIGIRQKKCIRPKRACASRLFSDGYVDGAWRTAELIKKEGYTIAALGVILPNFVEVMVKFRPFQYSVKYAFYV